MPEIFKSLNDMLKQDDGDNPMAQLLKQVINPGQLNTGLMGNMAANMMDKDPGPVMGQVAGQTGLSPEEIMRKLDRLEMYERARARKRGSTKK